MIRKPFFFLTGILFMTAAAISAQETPLSEEIPPGLRERAVVLDIIARIIEADSAKDNRIEVWNSGYSKITIAGKPVSFRLVGENLIVAVQLTPYLQPNGNNLLVAQGQIWIQRPGEGIRYQATLETIPLKFGELLYFFPLGSAMNSSDASIEIQIAIRPYGEGDKIAVPSVQHGE
ncbi:hypothetical protein FACS1894151_00430 [Spirochaetia bacterium]|nr:hypothetical protein FACS1894151_00430 [Spirochaetia bacterium]